MQILSLSQEIKLSISENQNEDKRPLTIITKSSILDVAAVLDPPLICLFISSSICFWLGV